MLLHGVEDFPQHQGFVVGALFRGCGRTIQDKFARQIQADAGLGAVVIQVLQVVIADRAFEAAIPGIGRKDRKKERNASYYNDNFTKKLLNSIIRGFQKP